jgi:hypothetical protein
LGFAVYGNLPTKVELIDWETTISQHSAVPEGVLVLTRTTLLLLERTSLLLICVYFEIEFDDSLVSGFVMYLQSSFVDMAWFLFGKC